VSQHRKRNSYDSLRHAAAYLASRYPYACEVSCRERYENESDYWAQRNAIRLLEALATVVDIVGIEEERE
jgi:hypothetical protein